MATASGRSASGEGAEHGHEREHVAVEVRVEGEQVGEVDEGEAHEHDVCAVRGALVVFQHKRSSGEREPGERDEQRRAEALPEPVEEGKRRRMVVLEPEPALGRQSLNARDVLPRGAGMPDDERAREYEGERRNPGADREPAPLSPPDREEGCRQEDSRILRRRREPRCGSRPLQPPLNGQSERDGDERRQQDVGHRDVRVRDVDRGYGNRRTGDEPGERAVGGATEPPGRRDADEPKPCRDASSRSVRRRVRKRLEWGEEQEQEARIVVPPRVEPAAVDELPRARHDRFLVGVEEWKREPVAQARDPERGGEREQRRETEPLSAANAPSQTHRRESRRTQPARALRSPRASRPGARRSRACRPGRPRAG